MIHVGASDAKTHLSSLLDKVTQGKDVLITPHRLPVARLIPAGQPNRTKINNAIERLRALHTGLQLDGLDWEELRNEGRL